MVIGAFQSGLLVKVTVGYMLSGENKCGVEGFY